MINRFSQYLVEEEKVVYFTFGRMNPPTIGHGKLLDKIASVAGRNPYKVFLSQSQDAKKNPLTYSDKIKHVRKMFPKHARSVMVAKEVATAMDAVVNLYNQGFRKIVMVVGSDRVTEFEALITKYNGKEARHGFYNFQDIKVISAGERDPDAEGAEGASATKQRAAASENDFITFSQGVPQTMNTKDTRKLFNDVRKGMGLSEETHFKNHVSLKPVSQVREAFVQGQLYGLGDSVIDKKTSEVGTVAILGANYVIVEMSDGKRYRKWLDAVELVEFKFPKTAAHRLDTKVPLKHQLKHGKQYGDFDNDGDTDKFDKTIEPDISGQPKDVTKQMLKKMKAEPKHIKPGIAFEATDRWYKQQPEWGTPESSKKAKKVTPGQANVKEESKGLWYNIQQRRKKGLPRLKPGDKNYPKTLDIE
jgi:hypothetical protein